MEREVGSVQACVKVARTNHVAGLCVQETREGKRGKRRERGKAEHVNSRDNPGHRPSVVQSRWQVWS